MTSPKSNPLKQPVWLEVLTKAVGLRRRADSPGELEFVSWLHSWLSKYGPVKIDSAGNLHLDLRNEGCKTLFIAHTDTVSRAPGLANTYAVTDGGRYLRATDDVLGADDGVGVAVLCHLIAHGTPGYYIFSRQEECGGVGAEHIARSFSKLLGEFSRAIAVDRRGTDSVIGHQRGARCASDEFCSALAEQLNLAEPNFMYSQDDTGVYTDTAEFIYLIPECTNLSAGYYQEHGSSEHVDLWHVSALAEAMTKVAWEELPAVRSTERPVYRSQNYGYGSSGFSAAMSASAFLRDYELTPQTAATSEEEEEYCPTLKALEEAIEAYSEGRTNKFYQLLAVELGCSVRAVEEFQPKITDSTMASVKESLAKGDNEVAWGVLVSESHLL